MAVKKDIVEKKLKFLAVTGLQVYCGEMDSFSLYNVLDFVKTVKNKIILDIGAKITDIIIVEEKKIWTRSILVGGNDLTKAIADDLRISFKEAEKIKREKGIIVLAEEDKQSSSYATAISNAISPVMVELLTDISKSIGYYKSQFGETKIFNEILITGGGSKLKNFPQFVRQNIDIPTKVFNLFENIQNDIDFSLSDDLIGRMDIAVGLSLRTVMPLSTKTNLLPKNMLRAKEFEKKKWYISGSLLAGILIIVTLTGFVYFLNNKRDRALRKTSAMIERYTKFHKEITALQNEVNDLKMGLHFIGGVSEKRIRSIETFVELARLLPSNLWLVEIRQDSDLFILKGRTKGTFEHINAFKDALIESGYFKAVDVKEANVLKGKDSCSEYPGSLTMGLFRTSRSRRCTM